MEDRPFEELADTAPVMLWRINSSFDRDWANKAWFDFTGGTLAEQTGFAWLDLVHPDDSDRAMEEFGRAFEAREPVCVELRVRGKDGRYRWFEDRGSPCFRDGAFAGFVGSCVDVTERKEAEERARLLCAETIRLSLATGLGRGPRGPALRVRADLAAVLRSAEASIRAHPAAAGTAIEWSLAGGLEAELNAPEIELVLVSLAANAFEAMRGVERRRLGISAASWGALAIVAVADSGPGIPPELRHSLFRSLPPADAQKRGLGLYLCRTIVAGHGGRIWAEPGPDGGAVLKFTLPLAA